MVADEAAFAPRLFPGLVEAAAGLADQFQVALQAPVAERFDHMAAGPVAGVEQAE